MTQEPPDEQRRQQLEALAKYVANLGVQHDEPDSGRPPRGRRWVSWAWGLLALLIVVAALLFGVLAGSNVRHQPLPPASVAGGTPTAVVVGDSMCTVTAPAGSSIAFPSVIGRLLGWRVTIDAVAGSGFSAPAGREGSRPSFASRVRAITGDAPAVVVVALGSDDADAGVSAKVVRAQATVGLQDLRRRLPAARVVAVGPLPSGGTPSPAQQAIRDAIRAAAQTAGAQFIDPIAEQWITGDRSDAESGNAAQMLASDGRHLTPSGHAYVGLRLATDLSRLAPPTP
jgi:lysophospholipase L1-like esterase